MTSTPPDAPATPPPAPPGGPRVTRDDVRDLARLRRTVGPHRYVAGVAGGVARHLDIDPAIVRVLFVVLSFFGGTGLLLYGALWLILPADDAGQAIVNLDSRSLMFAVVGLLAISAVLLVGDSWGGFGFPWPLTVIGIVAAVVLLTRDRRSVSPPPPSASAAPASPEAPPYGGGPTYGGPMYPAGPEGPPGPAAGVPWTPPPPPAWTRPPDPRKRGPVLFGFTLALLALGIGVLGLVDVSGVDVDGSAYPALALGLTGLVLLVSAFFGRGGGLILLGLLIAPVLAVTTLVDDWDGDVRVESPVDSSEVRDRYQMDAGELFVDLSGVGDPAELDGRTVEVSGGLGRLEVIVPDDVDVNVSAVVDGPGSVTVFDESRGGIETRVDQQYDVSGDVATLTLDVDLGVGEIVVTDEEMSSR